MGLFNPLPSPPETVQALDDEVRAKLPFKIPVSASWGAFQAPDVADAVDVVSDAELTSGDAVKSARLLDISGAADIAGNTDAAEINVHEVVGEPLRQLVQLANLRWAGQTRVTRVTNSTTGSSSTKGTSSRKKPDEVIRMNNKEMIRGELKARSLVSQLELAKKEAAEKLVANQFNYGTTTPYVLAFVSAGVSRFQLGVIPLNAGGAHVFENVGPECDLSTARGRLDAVRGLVHYLRVAEALSRRVPDLDAELASVAQEKSDVVMNRAGQGVFKNVDTVDRRLYGDGDGLLRRPSEHRVQCTDLSPGSDGRFVLTLQPFGRRAVAGVEDTNDATMRGVMWAVLSALAELHGAGLCHCDVRWPNVLYREDCRGWMLIDYEYARSSGETMDKLHADAAVRPWGLDCEAAPYAWTAAHDLYQAGVLMAGASSDDAREVAAYLMKERAGDDPPRTAAGALGLPWFAGLRERLP